MQQTIDREVTKAVEGMQKGAESHAEKVSQGMHETGAMLGEDFIRGAHRYALWVGLLSAGGATTTPIIDVAIIPRMVENLQVVTHAVRRLRK